MPDIKFTQLPVATTPLAGDEVLAIVQSGVSRQTTVGEISSTLQEAYDIGNGSILLASQKPFALTGFSSGLVLPYVEGPERATMVNPNNGLMTWDPYESRLYMQVDAPSAPTWFPLAFLYDVQNLDLQDVYDNGVTGNINLVSGKPFTLSSVTAGFLMPRMTELQFNQIVNPDAGLLAYASNLQRFITNVGTPSAPDYKTIAFEDDIPIFQNVGYGEMYFINNTTPTLIFAPNIPVTIAGTYLAGNLSQFQQSGDALIYNGISPAECQITVNLSGSMTSDTDTFNFVVYINGVRQTKSQQSTYFGPTSPGDHNVALQMLVLLNPLDQITVRVENTSDADPITVVNFNCIIQELIVGLGQISSIDLQAAYNNGDGSILQNPGKPLSLDVNSDTYYSELTMNNEAILGFGKEAARISFSYGGPSGQLQNASYIRVVNVGGITPPIEKIDRMQFYCGLADQPELYLELDPLSDQLRGYKTLSMFTGASLTTTDGVLSISSLSGVSHISIPGTLLNGINAGAIRVNHTNSISGVSFGCFPKIGNAAIASTRAVIETATYNYPKNTYQSVWFSSVGNNPYTGELVVRPNEFPIGSKISIEITGLVRYKTVSNQAVGNFKWSFKDQSGSNVIFDLTSNNITTPSISSRVSRPFQLTLNMVRVTNGLTLSQSGFFVTQPNNMLPLIFNFPDNLGTNPTTGFFPFNPQGINFYIDLEYKWNDGGNNTGFDFMCSGLSINEYVAFDPEFYV